MEEAEEKTKKKLEVPVPNVSEVLEAIKFVIRFYESMAENCVVNYGH